MHVCVCVLIHFGEYILKCFLPKNIVPMDWKITKIRFSSGSQQFYIKTVDVFIWLEVLAYSGKCY